MRNFRRFVLVASAAALAAGLPAGAADAAGPGAAAIDLDVTFDTPIPAGECSTTTSTLSGSLTGAFTLGGETVHGTFSLDGTGAPWAPSTCNYPTSGNELFAVTLTGTGTGGGAGGGRAIACTVDLAVIRTGWSSSIGLFGGTCTIDGTGSHELDGSLAGATVSQPVTGSPTTGYTFAGAFAQLSEG